MSSTRSSQAGGTSACEGHERIVAAFDSHDAGERARSALIEAGVPDSAIAQLEGEIATQSVGDQLLEAFMSLFSRAANPGTGAHSVAAGHVLIVVCPDSVEDCERIVALLDMLGPIDLQAAILPSQSERSLSPGSKVRLYSVPAG